MVYVRKMLNGYGYPTWAKLSVAVFKVLSKSLAIVSAV